MGGAGLLVAALVGLYLVGTKRGRAGPGGAELARGWSCEECYQNFLLYGIEHPSWEPHPECRDCDWEAQLEPGPGTPLVGHPLSDWEWGA
jgi:hypothetical protein